MNSTCIAFKAPQLVLNMHSTMLNDGIANDSLAERLPSRRLQGLTLLSLIGVFTVSKRLSISVNVSRHTRRQHTIPHPISDTLFSFSLSLVLIDHMCAVLPLPLFSSCFPSDSPLVSHVRRIGPITTGADRVKINNSRELTLQ